MKSEKQQIAIVGATGNVGRKLIELLIVRGSVALERLQLLASTKSDGITLEVCSHAFIVQDIQNYDFKNCCVAIFATDSDVSGQYISMALNSGARVVDASALYRLDPAVPLIVPPVNSHLITNDQRLFSHANCLASPLAMLLNPLHKYAVVTRVKATTYQSVSGAGKIPMDELYQQTKNIFEGNTSTNINFQRPIAFNVIPQIGEILNDGFSHEEFKIMKEVQKIISPDIKIAVTSVRVPVMIGHGISLAIEFDKKILLDNIKEILSQADGIKLSDNNYTTPIEAEGKNEVFVGRIRKDPTVAEGVLLWSVSDNLRRGAALDEVEILEKILKNTENSSA